MRPRWEKHVCIVQYPRSAIGESAPTSKLTRVQRMMSQNSRRTLLVMNQNVVGWIGMSATLAGVAIQSLLPELTRYSFLIFLAAALLWFFNGALTRNRPLMSTQVVLIVLNSVAVYRWFN
jgi:uncharacterized membrane protein